MSKQCKNFMAVSNLIKYSGEKKLKSSLCFGIAAQTFNERTRVLQLLQGFTNQGILTVTHDIYEEIVVPCFTATWAGLYFAKIQLPLAERGKSFLQCSYPVAHGQDDARLIINSIPSGWGFASDHQKSRYVLLLVLNIRIILECRKLDPILQNML